MIIHVILYTIFGMFVLVMSYIIFNINKNAVEDKQTKKDLFGRRYR